MNGGGERDQGRPSRAILFAHHDRDAIVDNYVVYLVSALRRYASTVIVVTASGESARTDKLEPLCDRIIARENRGYDFMSWKVGYEALSDPAVYDEILLVNDSIYGPLFSLDAVFDWSARQHLDCWGLTSNKERGFHVQSYFLAFRRPIVQSGFLANFLNAVAQHEEKDEVIARYEVGLTRQLEEAGFTCGAFFDPATAGCWRRLKAGVINGPHKGRSRVRSLLKVVKNERINPMHILWRSALESGVPFIKVQLLRDNPSQLELHRVYRYLEQLPTYDLRLIEEHLSRVKY